jgi:hypothetical protein
MKLFQVEKYAFVFLKSSANSLCNVGIKKTSEKCVSGLMALILLFGLCCSPVTCSSFEELNETLIYNKISTDGLQEVIHCWLQDEALPEDEYAVNLVKDFPSIYGNLSFLSITKVSGEPVDTGDLMIITINPNARGQKARIVVPNSNNTKCLSFSGTSPFWNIGNFPKTGQFFGEYMLEPGMTVIADEYANYDSDAVWDEDEGAYNIDGQSVENLPCGMTGMQAMFADWGDDPGDPSDDSLHAGDIVTVMLVETSTSKVLFNKEVIVFNYPSDKVLSVSGTADFEMISSVEDECISLEYLGGAEVYPGHLKIAVTHGIPTMSGFIPPESISYPDRSPLGIGDIITISFDNNCIKYNPDPYDLTSENESYKVYCCPMLDEQVICEGEKFRLTLIDNQSNEVLDSDLIIMDGGEIPRLYDDDPVTREELQEWIHCWLNYLPGPSGPYARFHVELNKGTSTYGENASYLTILQTAGDAIHTKDLKIITTNPNARGENKTMEIVPNVENTCIVSFTGTSPFRNTGSFPVSGQFFGEYVIGPGISMLADEFPGYESDAIWDPDTGDYIVGSDGYRTGMQAMFADWGDDPGDLTDDTINTGDTVGVKIIHTPSNKVLFNEMIEVNADVKPDYPYADLASFEASASISESNISLTYSGDYPLYREQLKVMLSTGNPPMAVALPESCLSFYPDSHEGDIGRDFTLLNSSDKINISFASVSGVAVIETMMIYEGDEFTLLVVDEGSGQVVCEKELTMNL